MVGSSPLTRGKPGSSSGRQCRSRLIPAHAGKTNAALDCGGHWRAHPRSRGENGRLGRLTRRCPGSSPLTRGKPRSHPACELSGRLIPAHAGKTLFIIGYPDGQPAHPRSRGENAYAHHLNARGTGSSPLTRGKRLGEAVAVGRVGLIPAHAGKTTRGAPLSFLAGAHPRSRGENPLLCVAAVASFGSSPLTRGKRRSYVMGFFQGRLIPAHAGKTRRYFMEAGRLPAHPRSRGENTS